MLEGLKHLISLERPLGDILRDIADILIVAFILYRALLVLKGTRAMQMGLGFVAFGLLYLVAKYAELATLMSVLSYLASSAILILVVVFQNDIRRALIRLGSQAWFTRGRDAQERVIEEVVAASTELARHRMGAIICLERDANVLEFVKNDGIEMDSMVSRELLVSMFVPESVNKTHDGAVLIRDLRMARAGLFFPMPELTRIADPTLGSRHRAAIGITEETDAVVVVVSEERGTITLCFPNGMVQNVDGASLKQALLGLIRGVGPKERRGLWQRIFGRPVQPRPPAPKPVAAEPKPVAVGASGKQISIITRAPTAAKTPASGTKTPAIATTTSKSGRHPAIKKETSQSGRYTPLSRSDAAVTGPARPDESAPQKTPSVPPRVSMPMPTSKDRKPAEAKPDSEETPGPRAVSKPMTPTELPSIRPPPGDDS